MATTYVALLRAVNLGGKNAIAMAELRAMCEEIGLTGARTLLQSGNLVVRSSLAPARLVAVLERATAQRFGAEIPYVVRSAAAWSAMIDANPFPAAARDDPAHLVALCCTAAPAPEAVDALRRAIVGRETVAAVGANGYVVYPDGIGDSKLTAALIEKWLGVRVTARNWNTVRKLAALAAGCGPRSSARRDEGQLQ